MADKETHLDLADEAPEDEHDDEKLDECESTSAGSHRTIGPSVVRGAQEVAAHGEILTGSCDGIVKID